MLILKKEVNLLDFGGFLMNPANPPKFVPNYFRLRTEGVLPAPASQSLIY